MDGQTNKHTDRLTYKRTYERMYEQMYLIDVGTDIQMDRVPGSLLELLMAAQNHLDLKKILTKIQMSFD